MADNQDKHPQNVKGKFYVDTTCIGCNACVEEAPDNFDIDEYTDNAYVFKQPADAAELEACRRAMNECPVEAIGDDG
jgi:ferredoxin